MDIIIAIALVVIAVCVIFVTFILWFNINSLNALYSISWHVRSIKLELEESNRIYERMMHITEEKL